MKNMKLKGVFAALSGVMLVGAISPAMADSNDDIIYALMAKGVLTEEEGHQLLDGRDKERATTQKNQSKGISISNALDSVELTGDIRARYEYRKADGLSEATPAKTLSDELDRGRYAWHLGVKGNAGDFFSEFRLASNSSSRSPNVDFAANGTAADGTNGKAKGAVYVDRAYVGWNVFPWATVIAGRMENQNYTSVLTWDKDITPEGLTEKFKYDVGNAHLFANLDQWYIQGKYEQTVLNGVQTTKTTLQEYAFQGGVEYDINDKTSFKVAPMYSFYTGSGTQAGATQYATFIPGLSNVNNALAYGNPGTQGVNHLKVIDIPAQFDYMFNGYGFRVWGDYAYNTDADKRAADAGAAYANYKGENTAYLIGVQVGSSPDLKTWRKQSTYWGDTKGMKKSDWSGRLWWQHIEAFALDQNQIDSDIMNAQVNMEGWATSGLYMLSDNTFATATYAHGSRINSALGTGYSVDTNGVYPNNYNMLQLDLTWKF